MSGNSKCIYTAITELVEIDKVLGFRSPQPDETLENGHKIPIHTKIYFLKLDGGSPVQKTFGPRHICLDAKKTVDAIAQFPMLSEKILHGPAELHKGGSYMLVFQNPDGYILEVAHKST